MFAQPQPLAGQTETLVPGHPPVAPVFVPLARCIRMAEELDLHLLELARSECEIPRRNFVAETLAHLGDAEWDADTRAIEHVFEVHEDALGRLRTKESGV